ncbi:MAG: hypothetical protein IJS29_02745, partial [Selenomonadaceae bacterium]|nr:hypothetical protein [Selenomonadaceae bacterium]
MAEYNVIFSSLEGAPVEGTDSNDSIAVYGNHSTVNAMGGADVISVNGGRHDSGVWIKGDETNIVNAGEGNDSINVYSRGASIYGDAGNDTVKTSSGHFYADGGAGDEFIFVDAYRPASDLNYITITGGAGDDTLEIRPYDYYSSYRGKIVNVIVTDFSNDDSFRY